MRLGRAAVAEQQQQLQLDPAGRHGRVPRLERSVASGVEGGLGCCERVLVLRGPRAAAYSVGEAARVPTRGLDADHRPPQPGLLDERALAALFLRAGPDMLEAPAGRGGARVLEQPLPRGAVLRGARGGVPASVDDGVGGLGVPRQQRRRCQAVGVGREGPGGCCGGRLKRTAATRESSAPRLAVPICRPWGGAAPAGVLGGRPGRALCRARWAWPGLP